MVSIGLGVICKAAQYRPDLLTQVGAEELARTGELWKGSEWRKVARRKVPAERPGWQFQRDWKPAFIEALRMTGNVTHAAQYAGRIEIGRPSLMPAASASCDARSLASSTAPLRAAPSGPRSSRGNCPLQTRRLLTWRYTVGPSRNHHTRSRPRKLDVQYWLAHVRHARRRPYLTAYTVEGKTDRTVQS